MAARQALAARNHRQLRAKAAQDAALAYQEMTSLLRTVQGLEVDEEIMKEMKEEEEFDAWGRAHLGIPGFSVRFTLIIAVFVCLNAITIGLETDLAESNETLQVGLGMLEHLFCVVFLIEMIIRLIVMRMKYFQNLWLLLDAGLVLLAVFDSWIVPFLTAFNLDGIGNLSALRLIRLLRLVRLVKLMRSCRELWLLVCGLMAGLKTLFWVAILMALALYICAVLCVQTIGQDPTYPTGEDVEFTTEKYFKNIPTAMLTLWECLNDGCTADVVRPVVMHNPIMIIFFLSFVMVMVHGFLNILVGVFVDGTMESAKEQETKINRQREMTNDNTLAKVRTVYALFDKDGNSQLSTKEFFEAWKDPEMQAILAGIGLDQISLGDLYSVLDLNADGGIEMSELVTAFMYLHNALKKPLLASYLISLRTLGILRCFFSELAQLYKALGGEVVSHLPNAIDQDSQMGTPHQSSVGVGAATPKDTPPPASTGMNETQSKNQLAAGKSRDEAAADKSENLDENVEAVNSCSSDWPALVNPGEKNETKTAAGNGGPSKVKGDVVKPSPDVSEKSVGSSRKRPPPLQEKAEPEDFFGEIQAFPSGFEYLLDDTDKIDGRPFLLCFEGTDGGFEREAAYLDSLMPATMHWYRWSLCLWMVAAATMPFTELEIVPDLTMWVRFVYRVAMCLGTGVLLAYMMRTNDSWSLGWSRQGFLTFLLCINVFFSSFLRPKRLSALLGISGEVKEYDTWWELVGIVYVGLLSNFPARFLIPVLLFAMAMAVFSATLLDTLVLGNPDTETLQGVVPFVAVDAILIVYVYLTDRQKRFGFILQQRIEQPEPYFQKPAAPGPQSGTPGRGSAAVLPE